MTRPLSWAAVAVCASVIAGVWVWQGEALWPSGSVWEGSRVASDDAPVDLNLAEGTHIELDPRSEVQLLSSSAHSLQLELRTGSARFDVAKRRTRRFSVRAGGVEVLVTGTQFRVTRGASDNGDRVHVTVDEGTVEVHRDGQERVVLHAGESWSSAEERVAPPPAPAPSVERAEAEPAEADRDTRSERERRAARSMEVGGAPIALAATPQKVRAPDAPPSPAEELFERANVARRAGLLRDAADLFHQLVQQHPQDRHAALSAFELGRMRMDSFGDMRGAVEALERALALDARRAFAEDALARLALAHEALGDAQSCVKARDRYLGRYPEGVHARYLIEHCVSKKKP